MAKELIKTDKNGTKYWHCTCTCSKCKGEGYIQYYHYNEGGLCFDCNGRGIVEWNEKEYTPEYEAKLAERRAKTLEKKKAKAIAESAEKNKAFFERNNFDENGFCWVVLGNTYPIKDELKEAGARFNNLYGWNFNHEVTEYPVVKIHVDDAYKADYSGTYSWNYWKNADEETYSEKIAKATEALNANDSDNASEWVGEIGNRIEIELTYKRHIGFDTFYGFKLYHFFEDENGNEFVWKTTNSVTYDNGKYTDCVDEGSKVFVKATIKEHSEYKGTKQTELTRLKVNEVIEDVQ